MHAPPGVTGGETLDRNAGQGLALSSRRTLIGGSRVLPNRLRRLRRLCRGSIAGKHRLKAEQKSRHTIRAYERAKGIASTTLPEKIP